METNQATEQPAPVIDMNATMEAFKNDPDNAQVAYVDRTAKDAETPPTPNADNAPANEDGQPTPGSEPSGDQDPGNVDEPGSSDGASKPVNDKGDAKPPQTEPEKSAEVAQLESLIAGGRSFDEAVEIMSTDFEAMSVSDLLDRQIAEQFPDSEPEVLAALKQSKLKGLGIDLDKPDEVATKAGLAQLEKELAPYRSDLIKIKNPTSGSESVTDPAKGGESDPDVDAAKTADEDQGNESEKLEQYKAFVDDHDATKALLEANGLTVKVGDSEIKVEVADPSFLKEAALDDSKFFSLMSDGKGGVDLEKFFRVVAFAQNEESYMKAVLVQGKAEGAGAVVDDLTNPSKPGGSTPSGGSPLSDKERFAQAAMGALRKAN